MSLQKNTSDAAAALSGSATASPNGAITLKRLVDVLLFVGPSGCGKSTIITRLQREWPDVFGFSVSHTTRAPRQGEVDGQHYHFVSRDEFQRLINSGAMIEYSRLSTSSSTTTTTSSSSDAATPQRAATGGKNVGHMYGTSKKSLHKVLDNNKVVLMDTDLLGAINIRRYCAHAVIDSKPVTVARNGKEAAATTATPSPSAGATGRYANALLGSTVAAQSAVGWRAPRLDVPAVQLKCHDELPVMPPVSSMPNASRLVRCVVIFIAPPSMQDLEERLRGRKSETEESLRARMALNAKWMRWARENQGFFDHYIVNDKLEQCYERVKKIVMEEVVAVASSL